VDETERAERLLEAQAHAADLFVAIGSERIIRPGVLDSQASRAVTELAADRFGVKRHWHKRIVRSGENTLHPYQENPPDREMTDDDIVFADFGPVFEDWEADFGRTWVLGTDRHKLRLRDDVAELFDTGKRYFHERRDLTAEDLFAEILRLTAERGWEFGNVHSGHLVGEFPHENFDGGRLVSLMTSGNKRPLRTTDPSGRIAHWILEIHLIDRSKSIGGFYEELLTL
jgi:Xaa-Pro aminopeptidase